MFAELHQTSTLEVSRQTPSVRFRLVAGRLTVIKEARAQRCANSTGFRKTTKESEK
jgi:hypothetical protein